jgi:hypothetical protein
MKKEGNEQGKKENKNQASRENLMAKKVRYRYRLYSVGTLGSRSCTHDLSYCTSLIKHGKQILGEPIDAFKDLKIYLNMYGIVYNNNKYFSQVV